MTTQVRQNFLCMHIFLYLFLLHSAFSALGTPHCPPNLVIVLQCTCRISEKLCILNGVKVFFYSSLEYSCLLTHPSPSHLHVLLSMGTNSLALLTNINLKENKGGQGGKKPQKRDHEKDRRRRKRKRTNDMLNRNC